MQITIVLIFCFWTSQLQNVLNLFNFFYQFQLRCFYKVCSFKKSGILEEYYSYFLHCLLWKLVFLLPWINNSHSRILTWSRQKLRNFGSHIGDGDNTQRLHGTTLQVEERKEKQNDISVSRKFGCWCINKISRQINLIRFVYYFVCSNILLYT